MKARKWFCLSENALLTKAWSVKVAGYVSFDHVHGYEVLIQSAFVFCQPIQDKEVTAEDEQTFLAKQQVGLKWLFWRLNVIVIL